MKIICAGQIKTGTKSLAKALEILGFKVYDFDSQLLHHGKFWFDVYMNGTWPDLRSLHEASREEIDALVDLPSAFFFDEILECFPDIKVIHTVRDEDAWLRSAASHIRAREAHVRSFERSFARLFSQTQREIDAIEVAYLNAIVGTADPNSQAVLRKRYRLHNAHVESVVPKDKLLVFNVKQGWEPLCEFLSCAVPEEPFPQENVRAEIFRREVLMERPAIQALVKTIRAEVGESIMVVLAVCTMVCILVLACVLGIKD